MENLFAEARRRMLERRARLAHVTHAELAESAAASESIERGDSPVGNAVLATLSEHERNEMREIDAALARIDNGTYGRCESCGHAVGRQRLRAVPEARLCAACAGVR